MDAVKTMIVVGSAPCLYDDVDAALRLRPFASLMLVNGACTAIENAEHVLAGHEEKAEFFAAARRERFPSAPPWRLHGTCHAHRLPVHKQLHPSVTDWWPFETGVGATSASKAAKLALKFLGCNEVILAGCPMDGGGYFAGEAEVPQDRSCVRVGSDDIVKGFVTPHHAGQYTTQPGMPMKAQETKIVRLYRARLAELARTEFKGKVFSMSGFTREQLGYPKEI